MTQNLLTSPLRLHLGITVCLLWLASLAALPSAHATLQGAGAGGNSEFVAADVNVGYVLYNAGTRQTAIWYLINNALVSSSYGPSLPAGWQVAGVATTGSGQSVDAGGGLNLYYLFDSVTRQTAIWHFSGASLLANYPGPTLPSGWALAGVRDFNGDGKLEFVLYKASTRQTALWYLNNNGVFTSGIFGPTLPAGWTLIDVADFNLDGYQDYLLLNKSDRRTAIWYLRDNVFAGSLFGPTIPAGWSLVALSEVGNPWDY